MSLFVIGDLHLSLAVDKPMDIFGGWENYTERLHEAWCELVSKDDTVVLAGDISWAMSLESAHKDFEFIENLPGKKIILKGNHDYWWTTQKKMKDFFSENGFSSINILHNNSYEIEGVSICGTRGWIFENGQPFDEKITNRECCRLKTSLDSAKADTEKIVFLHYPPIFGHERAQDILGLLTEYGVRRCYYGHLHGPSTKISFNGEHMGVDFRLISADYLYFRPLRIEI